MFLIATCGVNCAYNLHEFSPRLYCGSLTVFSARPYIVYMLRDSEIREDWAAITIAVKQSQEYLRHHDSG